MKIALIVPEYPPFAIGGGAQIYEKLALNYQKKGHQVVVFYGYYPAVSLNQGVKKYISKGITFYQIPLLPTPSYLPFLKLRMPISLAAFFKISKLLRNEGIEIAHLHGYGFLYIDTFAYLLKRIGIKYILTVHGWPINHLNSNLIVKNFFIYYLKIASNYSLENAEKITCVSHFLKTCLPVKFRGKTITIYNGFEAILEKSKIDIYKKYQIDKSQKIILSLGRIAYIKGFQEVIKKLVDLNKGKISYTYLIAGEDEGYKNELINLIKNLGFENQVKFIGQIDNQEKIAFLKQAEIIAIPSLIEGFGLVALEAAYFKKLILYGQAKAVREILVDYPKKVLLSNENLVNKLRQEAKMKSKFNFSKFSWNIITDQYLTTLRKACE